MERPIKVRLTADLTRYHPKLQVGAEGYTVGAYGMWSRGSDRFIGVRFPEAVRSISFGNRSKLSTKNFCARPRSVNRESGRCLSKPPTW
jgi:hypothetical protein